MQSISVGVRASSGDGILILGVSYIETKYPEINVFETFPLLDFVKF